MTRIIDPLEQFFDDAGDPLIGGLLYFYATGTNTLLDTFADVNLSIPNTNPLELTAAGRSPDAYGYNRLYRVVLKNSSGVQILQRDNVGSLTGDSAFTPWIYDKVYNIPDIATYANKFYLSKVNGNQDNQPDISTQWAQIRFMEDYKSGFSYSKNDVVFSNFILYLSLVDTNAGNTPASSPNQWERIGSIPAHSINRTYAQYDLCVKSGIVYRSQQNTNLNHDPATDTAYTWWKPESRVYLEANPQLLKVNPITGGGTLLAEWNNVIGDGNAGYLLPLANSVPANTAIIISKSDIARTLYPKITRSGSDTIRWLGGTDTDFDIDTQFADSMILYSNGSNQWSF